jgi:hypothetical protein
MQIGIVAAPELSALQKPRFAPMYPHRHLAGRHGRIALADCQAHVQPLPNIDKLASGRADARGFEQNCN